MHQRLVVWLVLMATLPLLAAVPAPAAASDGMQQRLDAIEQRQQELDREIQQLQRQDRLDEIERRQSILATEFEKLKSIFVLPEEATYKSFYGLGPAASKIYQRQRGLSLGAYGQTWAQLFVKDKGEAKNVWDFKRFILYAGYKFTERLLINAEIEFEHATTGSTESAGSGSASVEFAALDYLFMPELNVRAGLLLVPFGFLNEIHEPPYYYGNERPEVERQIIPSTWRENGAGLFGEFADGLVQYRLYVITSFNAEGFGEGDIRDARQKGNRALAEDMALVTRVDVTPFPGLLVGGSLFVGNTGQDQDFGGQSADAFMVFWEAHAEFNYRGLHIRALGTMAHIDDTEVLSSALERGISDTLWGWYAEIAYDVLPLVLPGTRMALAPFFRYERFNTQADVPAGFTPNENFDRRIIQVGVNFWLHPNVVIKADYRDFDAKSGPVADDFNIGFGFAF